MKDLVSRASRFAVRAHEGHLRKYHGSPYITHPARVARAARKAGLSDEAIAAAWLHDVVEDVGVTIEEVKNLFGERVSFLVWSLSDLTPKSEGNRALRKSLYARKLHKSRDPEVHTIKTLDILDNAPGIKADDPGKFWRVYLKEAKDLAEALDLAHEGPKKTLLEVLEDLEGK